MQRHQVVIVCGDTGSGKTTQLPKIALELGRGRAGQEKNGKRIGCTQPRRIAATSVARRVAEEMQVEPGQEVGYQIRFEDRTQRDATAVKFMTDGILLAETRGDPLLRQYDTLIIDEAHERSLNIDFILGYLYRLLPKRPDLKVVISSATLDAETFADFYSDTDVVEVEGRAFPVEDIYQPPLHSREHLADQVARAVEDLAEFDPLGDTLVFLPGEREIREIADLLDGRRYPFTEVLPLFARQAGNEQQAVFRTSPHSRRIILATNVAETSLTIPDIRSVIDSGIARVNRYDPRCGIQRLQIEPISKASARQRRGRCGRVADGICVRLYDEADFEDRPDFTDPEILRSNLAGVVLQMEHLGLGDPMDFPFVDKPQPKRISEAYQTLQELGAVGKKHRGKSTGLTEIGRTLARLPVDPRVGRLLVAANDEDCLREGLIVASALTIQDPRERPQEKQQQADQAHGKFRDRRSDFTGWLMWWHAIENNRKSNNSLRRFCKQNFLNYRRTQEWLNLHRELRSSLRALKWKLPNPKTPLADPAGSYNDDLHRAILTAIPSQIGYQEQKVKGYKGAGNQVFHLFPGSGVFGAAPKWVMAFEMVETAKLYARNLAHFDPAWVEKVAPHVCRYRYDNPHWVPETGAVYGEETVVAFGLPVIERRRIHYGRVDVGVARRIFIQEALVNGETRSPLPLLARNIATIAAAERLEHKLRRGGGLVHWPNVTAFYEERIPADVCTQKAFEKWASRAPEGTLDLELDDCILPLGDSIDADDYPDAAWSTDEQSKFELVYLHHPTDPADGITIRIPLGDLPHLPPWFGDWLVPGWLPEKVGILIRSLGKYVRQRLPAHRETVDHFIETWHGYVPRCSLVEAIIDFLHTEYDVEINENSFDYARVPQHLVMRYEIVGPGDKVIGVGRDLGHLQEKLAVEVQARFADIRRESRFEKSNLRRWSIGDLPESLELDRHTVGYPGLHAVTDNDSVVLRLWPSPDCATSQHRLGVAALFRIAETNLADDLEKVLFAGPLGGGTRASTPVPAKGTQERSTADNFGSLAAAFGDIGAANPPASTPMPTVKRTPDRKGGPPQMLNKSQLLLLGQLGADPRRNRDDLVSRVLIEHLGQPRTRADWASASETSLSDILETSLRICGTIAKLLTNAETINRLLDQNRDNSAYAASLDDSREHFTQLMRPGWLLDGELSHKLNHLRGLEARITRMLGSPPAKDLAKLERYQEASHELWQQDTSCECGECETTITFQAQLEADNDLRLLHFAQEFRRG